jgi:hypothetical protein
MIDEHVNGTKECINIVKSVWSMISRVFDDKGNISKTINNDLEGKALISIGKYAVTLSGGSPYIGKITRFIHRFNEGLLKMKNNYGLRWNVEVYFSRVNTPFGDFIRSVKPGNIVQEMILNAYFYDKYNKLRKAYK